MRIKICGITRPQDAQLAAACGADAIGLVMVAGSRRKIGLPQAAAICRDLPPFVHVVALFSDPTKDDVETAVANLPIDILQFHGSETPSFCRQFGRPYIKSFTLSATLEEQLEGHHQACALLCDSHRIGGLGGTGHCVDWAQAAALKLSRPLILAGGLRPDNIVSAITQVRPYAVDVSSGVELHTPGLKDPKKIQDFVRKIRQTEYHQEKQHEQQR